MLDNTLREILHYELQYLDSFIFSDVINDVIINRRIYLKCCSLLDFVIRCSEMEFIVLSIDEESKFFKSFINKIKYRKVKLDNAYYI